jgi:hypothetical protein
MLPTPIISTETLLSCADATQVETPKTIDANRDGFIIDQVKLAPLERPKSAVAQVQRSDCLPECRTCDACKLRGTTRVRSTWMSYSITTN